MRVGVAIDPWKLEVFERHLKAAGYEYEIAEGETMTVITVKTNYAHTLMPVVRAANEECARTGRGAT